MRSIETHFLSYKPNAIAQKCTKCVPSFEKAYATLELMIRDLGFYGANVFYGLGLAQRVRTSCVFMRRGLPRGGIWRFRRMRRAPVTAFQQPAITGA